MKRRKAVFFDRDGVLNYDDEGYVYNPDTYKLYPEVKEVVSLLKSRGYVLIVITNQAGLSRKIYTRNDMHACHQKLQEETSHAFDYIYYAPWHPEQSKSLSRKPGSLLFEKAMAKFGIDPSVSWMLGDRDRDLIPARKLGMKTIGVLRNESFLHADYEVVNLREVLTII